LPFVSRNPGRNSRIQLVASCLFFASGALGLGYQLVWVKKAALIVGGSQIALSTVVASFFLGLALGSLYVGRHLRSRRWSPLVVYGLFEVAIGAFALAFPILFGVVESAYSALYPSFSDSASALFAMRFALLFVFFLLPTFFMGGTLPLLLDGLVGRDQAVGSLTSLLYGLNIAGAVTGVLLTGYWAIPALGMNGTSIAAGCGNLAIGTIALLAFRRTPPLHVPAVDNDGESDAGATSFPPRAFVVLSFFSGFVALAYQILWARHFSLFTDSTVYFTSILLAVYLAALATGSMALSWLLKRGLHPLRVLAVTQPLVPVLAFTLLTAWRSAYRTYEVNGDPLRLTVLPNWSIFSDTIDAIFVAPAAQVALVLFVPVTLIGAGLPSLIAGATRSSSSLRGISGSLVFWNTVGSSAGGYAAGYLLIPLLGLTHSLVMLAAISIAIGMTCEHLLAREAGGGRPLFAQLLRRPGMVFGVAALGFTVFSSQRDIVHETLMQDGQGKGDRTHFVSLTEGTLTTAWVLRKDDRRYIGSGTVVLASANPGFSYQAMQGSAAPLLYPRPGAPKDVLGIALGSGQTFGGILLHPIEHMDVVDISTEIVGLSLEHFEDVQHGLASDPRVRFHIDDGRHFVARSEAESYDLISTEPPPPTHNGVHVLYSLEFYQETHRILRDGGMLVSWLPLYRITPDDTRGMLKTQATVFPYTFVIKLGTQDFAILSYKLNEPPLIRREWLEARMERFANEHHASGFHWPGRPTTYPIASVEGIVALFLTGPDDIASIDFPLIHREDDQRLGYSSGDRELLRRYGDLEEIARLSFTAIPMTSMAKLQQYFDEPMPLEAIEEDRAAGLFQNFGVASPRQLRELEASWKGETSAHARARIAMRIAVLYDTQLSKDRAYEWIGRALADGAESPRFVRLARSMARHGVAVYSEDLRAWLEAQPPRHRYAQVVAAMWEELLDFEDWDEQRRARFWLE
jgi:spermidine synthase